MGFTDWITNTLTAKRDIIKDTADIVDGVVLNMEEILPKKEPECNEDETPGEWEFPPEYLEYMTAKNYKERTIKEYYFDLRSFKENLDDIELPAIKERMKGLKLYTKKRKFTALRSFAKFRLTQGEAHLFLVLADYKPTDE